MIFILTTIIITDGSKIQHSSRKEYQCHNNRYGCVTAAAESQVPDDQSKNRNSALFPSLKKKLLLRRSTDGSTFNRSINNVNILVDSKSYPPQIKEKNSASVKNKVMILISKTTTITL